MHYDYIPLCTGQLHHFQRYASNHRSIFHKPGNLVGAALARPQVPEPPMSLGDELAGIGGTNSGGVIRVFRELSHQLVRPGNDHRPTALWPHRIKKSEDNNRLKRGP